MPPTGGRAAPQLLSCTGRRADNVEAAISEFSEALAIYRELLPADDRSRSHVHWRLGLAHLQHREADKALDQLTAAAAVLEKRVERLCTAGDGNVGEIDALTQMIKEIREKIEDEELDATPAAGKSSDVTLGPAGGLPSKAPAHGSHRLGEVNSGFDAPQLAVTENKAELPGVQTLAVRRKRPLHVGGGQDATLGPDGKQQKAVALSPTLP